MCPRVCLQAALMQPSQKLLGFLFSLGPNFIFQSPILTSLCGGYAFLCLQWSSLAS